MKLFSSPRTFFLILLGAFASTVLSAQTFYGAGVSAQTASHAGIFTPSSDNALDALVLNPAGLTAISSPVVDFSVTGIMARGSFTNAVNSASPMSSNNGVVPFGAFGTPIGHSRWTLGLGITPDLLSTSKWNYRDAPGFAGTSYGLQSEKSQILAFRASAAVGYALSSKVSVGATLGAVYNANTLDAPYIFQSNAALAGLKTLLDLHTTGVGWNTTFGVTARPSRRWELGASYRAPASITSNGKATGNMGVEFATLGIPFQPDFAYKAQVHVDLPPSALVNAGWQATNTTRLNLQTDWTGWRGSFNNLPVTLTQGTNSDINSFLGSNGIKDIIPLDWKDQFTFRGSVDRTLGESFSLSAGYLHGQNPVPASTLSPLTAAIMQNGVAAGAAYRAGRFHFNLCYGFDFTAKEQAGTSALLFDEYSHATTKIGTQALTLSTSFKL